MKKFLLFLSLSIAHDFSTVHAQPSFLGSSLATANDDLTYDFVPLPNGQFVFVGTINKVAPGKRWSDAIAFITDRSGNVLHQNLFAHNGDSSCIQFTQVYSSGSHIEVWGMEGFLDQNSSFDNPVYQTLVWTKLDTMLNVVQQIRYPIAANKQLLSGFKTVRDANSTHAIVTYWADYNGPLNKLRPRMLKFDAQMNLIVNKEPDAQMYTTTQNFNAAYFWDIGKEPQSNKVYVIGEVRISNATDSFLSNSNYILHKFDTAFALEDTFHIERVGSNYAGNDTFFGRYYPYMSAIGNGRVLLGPSFVLLPLNLSNLRYAIGLSLYNIATRKHRIRGVVPKYDTTDVFPEATYSRGVQYDGLNHAYAIGSTQVQFPFSGGPVHTDNKLTIAKYDTAANLLWYRFLGSSGAYYAAGSVECEGDTIVTILAARYDYVSSPSAPQADYYVLRLRASDGTPTAIFPLNPGKDKNAIHAYPNPATDVLHLRLPATIPATEATIISANGAVLRRARLATATEVTIPIADLPPGIYTWRVSNGSGSAGNGLFLKK